MYHINTLLHTPTRAAGWGEGILSKKCEAQDLLSSFMYILYIYTHIYIYSIWWTIGEGIPGVGQGTEQHS